MEEKSLLAFSFFIAFFGMSMLFFISENEMIPEVEYLPDHVGEDVTIKGKVVKARNGDVSFLSIETLQIIPVVSFESLNYKVGDEISLVGKVEYYKGNLEILVR